MDERDKKDPLLKRSRNDLLELAVLLGEGVGA